MSTILIVDDEIQICTLLTKILSKEGYEVDHSVSGTTALKMVKEKLYDVVFCDYRLKDKEIDGSVLSLKIRELSPPTGIVVMTGYPDVRVAIQLIKNGIYDYVVKPLNAAQVILLTQKALLHKALTSKDPLPVAPASPEAPVSTLVSHRGTLSQFVYGVGNASKELHVHIKLIAPTDYSVVILGETGTGKESVAQLIHSQSKRKNKPFVAIDCGSLSRELACSELFGHEKGAFTGAIQAKTGAFQEAHGGTLFLDEIGNLSYEVQTALLRAIQERVVRPVGSTRETPVDIRIIVASNEDLQQAVLNGRFRDDLYYRLNEFSVNVPPLRARRDDLPLFVNAFKQMIEAELNREYGEVSAEVYQAFYHYGWPGNIRELKNVMRRICLLSTNEGPVTTAHLPEEMLPALKEAEATGTGGTTEEDLKNVSRQAEYKKIMDVLQQVHYNKSEAARMMNIDRKTLYNKLHTLNIVL
ncbi:sigma-54-dependent transcriptional regulator [Chitinophaga agri]|uniref:Sigma-54-dependent Fis family transcriptional regulator n=1 Tax=Chitinophaga agri TaxID=2703787 RepID=A0A6B9ZAY8_9BACT|nr:sigma-54 dependent transcriptional regulator [Chitinophaga agri]QHS58275.1 sigma-54-dependent Fis family transcriptional regulator [Chitinophaga agri]